MCIISLLNKHSTSHFSPVNTSKGLTADDVGEDNDANDLCEGRRRLSRHQRMRKRCLLSFQTNPSCVQQQIGLSTRRALFDISLQRKSQRQGSSKAGSWQCHVCSTCGRVGMLSVEDLVDSTPPQPPAPQHVTTHHNMLC